jgi:hypothetical protein
MDGWQGMLLDDDFQIGLQFLLDSLGSVFHRKKVYYSRYHVFTCNIKCFTSLGTRYICQGEFVSLWVGT